MPGLVGLFGFSYMAMQRADDNSNVVIITCQQLHSLIELQVLQTPIDILVVITNDS